MSNAPYQLDGRTIRLVGTLTEEQRRRIIHASWQSAPNMAAVLYEVQSIKETHRDDGWQWDLAIALNLFHIRSSCADPADYPPIIGLTFDAAVQAAFDRARIVRDAKGSDAVYIDGAFISYVNTAIMCHPMTAFMTSQDGYMMYASALNLGRQLEMEQRAAIAAEEEARMAS